MEDDALARWLGLREPADRGARSERLTRIVTEVLPSDEPLSILDLATGAGSNVRYLAERLGGSQRWLAVDRSAALLAELPVRMASWAADRGWQTERTPDGCVVRGSATDCRIETRRMDLGVLPPDIFAGRHLVTASALLDLVSATWLDALAEYSRAAGAAVLCAITYNGRFSCSPVEPEDETVRSLMNQHQHNDKGLGGPAAGPEAVARAVRSLAGAGARVECEPSDWRLGEAEGELQRQLIEGWAEAAVEIAPEMAATVERWLARRLAHVEAGRSRIVVGHEDLAAWWPAAHGR